MSKIKNAFGEEFEKQVESDMDFQVSMSELEHSKLEDKEEGMVYKNFGGRMLPTLEELTLQ